MKKKKKYNQRVIQVDYGTFTPLVFNTDGGMGPEATKYHKRVAEKIHLREMKTILMSCNISAQG